MTDRSGVDQGRVNPAPGGISLAARLLMVLVAAYRKVISPVIPPRCRFYPSCSAYALEAIGVHGAGRGSWLAIRRLSRCHPFHPGGLDPVPPARADGAAEARARELTH